jgi:hypothetical protein
VKYDIEDQHLNSDFTSEKLKGLKENGTPGMDRTLGEFYKRYPTIFQILLHFYNKVFNIGIVLENIGKHVFLCETTRVALQYLMS